MAYTRTWNDATPAGTRAANEIDNAIRELKVDIHERMDDLCVDWDADPVVIADEFKGGSVDKYEIIGPSHWHTTDDEDDNNWRLNHFEPEGDHTARAHFVLPSGVTITEFHLVIDPGTCVSIVAELWRIEFSTGTETQVGTDLTGWTVGLAQKNKTGLSEVTSADRYYGIQVTHVFPGGTKMKIYGARVRYTAPDSRNTL